MLYMRILAFINIHSLFCGNVKVCGPSEDVGMKRSVSSNGAVCVYVVGNAFNRVSDMILAFSRPLHSRSFIFLEGGVSFHACDLTLSSGPFKHQRRDTCTHTSYTCIPAWPCKRNRLFLVTQSSYTVLLNPDCVARPWEHKADCVSKHCVSFKVQLSGFTQVVDV